MSNIKSHKDLEVYKQSMDLVEEVYRLSKRLPDEEKFGLVTQMRRVAVSIVY
ncbi:MAG: four helix bundle protein [Bacteroidetes bacterium]|nr:four helix bundle protein [Bacteroidota bacterium]